MIYCTEQNIICFHKLQYIVLEVCSVRACVCTRARLLSLLEGVHDQPIVGSTENTVAVVVPEVLGSDHGVVVALKFLEDGLWGTAGQIKQLQLKRELVSEG